MLVGCLAIAGAGLPFALTLFGTDLHLGFSGFYSKDAILEQALLFRNTNPAWGNLFFLAAAGGAAITAFYMFRLWYLTFAGQPRDAHRYDHAHESPPVMYRPLILLAILAIGVAWRPIEGIVGAIIALVIFGVLHLRTKSSSQHNEHHLPVNPLTIAMILASVGLLVACLWMPVGHVTLGNLLEQARPAGTLPNQPAPMLGMTWPNEHDSHAPVIKVPATWIAFSTAIGGFLLATVFYGLRKLDAGEAKQAFAPIYRLLWNKWWFDELYDVLFVRPTQVVSGWTASFDRTWIDGLIDSLAWLVRVFSGFWDRFADRTIVDGFVNLLASCTYRVGASLRRVQTGSLRQYVMFIVIGTVVVFTLAGFWRYAFAQ
jgi:NADH-quinone oxidoreductase subunit L